MHKILREDNPNSMQDFLKVAGTSDESMNGAKRLLGEMIFEEPKPYEFLSNPNNKAKIREIFTSPDEQAYLDSIEKASESIAKQKKTPGVEKKTNILDNALRPATMGLARKSIGYFGSLTGVQILQNIAAIPRIKINKIIVDGLLDPKGLGATLSKPMPPNDLNAWRKAYSRMLPGIIAGETRSREPNKEPTKYASGGPVYTPPAINSIRSARAQRNFAQ